MNHYYKPMRWALLLSGVALAIPFVNAQTDEDEEVFELNPFYVEGDEAEGYVATATLAGTRVRTDLRDLATPITAITAQFLEDTGSQDNKDLLLYTTNTEVGGLYGNWGGFGNTQGISDRGALLQPNNNTRVRGLAQADNTRNYFLTDIPWDSFNVDRVEIQRGPNSILFGQGSPAGLINTATISANFRGTSGKISIEAAEYGTHRWTLDYNLEAIPDLLAIRVAILYDYEQYQQEPTFNKDSRFFATGTFRPQLLPESWAGRTEVRMTVETGAITANNPRILPPEDGISLWFEDSAGDGVNDLMGLGMAIVDPFLWNQGGGGDPFRGGSAASVLNPMYLPGANNIDTGALNNGGVAFFLANNTAGPFFVSRQAPRVFPGGLGADGNVDTGIDYPYGSLLRGGSFNNYARALNRIDKDVNGIGNEMDRRFPFAERGYWKDRSLTDPTIWNFYDYLIDGDNKREYSSWDAFNAGLAQTLFKDRLGVEFVYDYQDYNQRRGGVTWNRPYISIDINKNLQNILPHYTRVPNPAGEGDDVIDPSTYKWGNQTWGSPPYPNPNAGSAITAGGFSNNSKRNVERQNYRWTAFLELRGSDIFDENSMLAQIIGRHIITGLYNEEEIVTQTHDYVPAATSAEWARSLQVPGGPNVLLNEDHRDIVPIVYLSEPLIGMGITSAHGLNLPPVYANFAPAAGTYQADYFDSTWIHPLNPSDPGYVDPAAETIGWSGNTIIEADNPYNYVGRTSKAMQVLNAEEGDIKDLTYAYDVTSTLTNSTGVNWQGHFLNGHLVPTLGWREDTLETYTYQDSFGNGGKDSDGVARGKLGDYEKVGETSAENVSWGVVAHVPADWMDNVPVLTGLSVYYNYGENGKVQTRYNYDGEPLANPTAESTDYGIVLTALEDKLSVKVGKYETKVYNSDLPGGNNLLGNNNYYLYQLEGWGTANALMYLMGQEGLDPNQNWHWNWAHIDAGWTSETNYPSSQSDLVKNHPSSVYQRQVIDAWIMGMDQSFFNNYDIAVDVPSVQAAYQTYLSTGNIQPLIDEVDPEYKPGGYTTSLFSKSNGNINGIYPNGTIDDVSEGYEVEINYQPTPNWNIQINAAKTDAYRLQLGQPMQDFIAKQWARMQGPAGDIRLWWGGDNTIRQYYEDNIIAALRFQEESVGMQAPELRPKRISFITNYSFTDGLLAGANIGGSIRWQDKQILGYGLKDANAEFPGLNVMAPIYGDTEDAIDLWIGYERKLTDKIDWRIQLNLRNVGKDEGLVAISSNPDGQAAIYRIQEGMSWRITNTFRF